MSHLNIEFSFCSDGNTKGVGNKENCENRAQVPEYEIEQRTHQEAINIFTNRIVLKEEY